MVAKLIAITQAGDNTYAGQHAATLMGLLGYDEFLPVLVAGLDWEFEPAQEAAEAARPAAEPAKVKTIQQVYDAYMADPGVIRSGKTVQAYETVFGLLIEIIGQDTPTSDIGRETCREVMDTLRWLPPNSTKRYPNLPACEIAFVIA